MTNMTDVQIFFSKNRRSMIRGRCVVCGGMKIQFVICRKVATL